MVAAFGPGARGRSRHGHLDLQQLECVAEALPRRGIDGIAQTLAIAAAAASDRPAEIAVGALARVDR